MNTSGRFAPSPSGRMHLGNLFSALISWLEAKSRNAKWVLRIEDLDPQRSRRDYALMIEDDLRWLGLHWDEGGVDSTGPHAPYEQSRRNEYYDKALRQIMSGGYAYPCFCTRADIMATQAPHQSDGRVVYAGTCRPHNVPCELQWPSAPHAVRLAVPDGDICFTDGVFGSQSVNLARHCGDFVLRRADGAWAYQLAVVVDDAAMEIGRVVRGADLLLSSAQQIYLYNLLGLPAPQFAHVPLLCNSQGRRLSKRDASLSMEVLRRDFTPEQIIGCLAYLAGIIPEAASVSAAELIPMFDISLVPATEKIVLP